MGDISHELIYRHATGDEVNAFAHLLREDAADYLDRTLALMGVSWTEFVDLVETVGTVRAICNGDEVVGYMWTEERDRILHLHGIVVRSDWRGQGIGTAALTMLVESYAGKLDAIELGVHESNRRALALYERLGYGAVRRLTDLGYVVMQRPLSPAQSPRKE